MLPVFLFAGMLLLMLSRVFVPIPAKVEGRLLKQVRLTFRERLLVQRVNIYAVGIALLLGVVGGWVSTTLELFVVLLVFTILMLPSKYVLTNEGVALNNILFRRWDEFNDYRLRGIRLELKPRHRARNFTLFVPIREQSEVMKILKRQFNSN